MTDAVFKFVVNNKLKDFPKWSAYAKNRRIAMKYQVEQLSKIVDAATAMLYLFIILTFPSDRLGCLGKIIE